MVVTKPWKGYLFTVWELEWGGGAPPCLTWAGICAEGNPNFSLLWRGHAMDGYGRTDLGVTNKFQWVRKFASIESANNKHQLYLFTCWSFLGAWGLLIGRLVSILDIFSFSKSTPLFAPCSFLWGLTSVDAPATVSSSSCFQLGLANKKPQKLMG